MGQYQWQGTLGDSSGHTEDIGINNQAPMNALNIPANKALYRVAIPLRVISVGKLCDLLSVRTIYGNQR